MDSRAADLLDLLARVRGQGSIHLGKQHVREAEDRVQGAPELVADSSEEGRAVPIRRACALKVRAVGALRGREALR